MTGGETNITEAQIVTDPRAADPVERLTSASHLMAMLGAHCRRISSTCSTATSSSSTTAATSAAAAVEAASAADAAEAEVASEEAAEDIKRGNKTGTALPHYHAALSQAV